MALCFFEIEKNTSASKQSQKSMGNYVFFRKSGPEKTKQNFLKVRTTQNRGKKEVLTKRDKEHRHEKTQQITTEEREMKRRRKRGKKRER
jgi:hypothetical protein